MHLQGEADPEGSTHWMYNTHLRRGKHYATTQSQTDNLRQGDQKVTTHKGETIYPAHRT